MKFIAAILLSIMTVAGVIDNIATVNRLKKEAEQAYKNGDYATAVTHYRTLVDSLNVQDDNVKLNLAHSLIQAGDTISARRNYSTLVRSSQPEVKSVAYQQLGIIASEQQEYEESLASFKEALKANPANEEARYNYELVKQLMEQQKEQEQEQEQEQENQNQDQQENQQEKNQEQQQQEQQQQGQDQQQQQQDGEQSQEQQGQKQEQQGQEGEQKPENAEEQNAQQGQEQQEGEKSDEQQSASPLSERLKEMNISEEKARMILEAMRNNEMRYIQQNRRRPESPRDRGKPDW
ncbi:MAG: tetratricopeptide repeat protein [Cyclobacteriaceae bacterium]